jgi:hypothetical protein
MHVIERIHLADKDILHVDLEIFAPQILTKPWKITRIFFRQRARKYDIVDFETGFDIAQRVLAHDLYPSGLGGVCPFDGAVSELDCLSRERSFLFRRGAARNMIEFVFSQFIRLVR